MASPAPILASEPANILPVRLVFFFNDTATTEIYTLSLHDALPISIRTPCRCSNTWTNWLASSSESRSEEHTSELQSRPHLVCRLLLEKKKNYFAAYQANTVSVIAVVLISLRPSSLVVLFFSVCFFSFFFFNDTATTEIYTLSLHDALPITGTPSADSRLRSWRGSSSS